MRILYVGYLGYGSTSHSRMVALKDLGHQIHEIDYWTYFDSKGNFSSKIQQHFLFGPRLDNLNRSLIKMDEKLNPEIVWIDKGLYIKPNTIEILKNRNRFIVQHNTDDLKYSKQGFNKYFIPAIPLADVHITSNTYNLNDFKEYGAKNVIHMELAYNHHLHKPTKLSSDDFEKYKADVSFIGHWEPNTESFIVSLRDRGINVRLLGTGWKNASDKKLRNSGIVGIYGDEYVKAICASKINLCFLSVWNRNVTAARSFEIPACKAFLLAVRNNAHLTYFVEGEEAEFFSDIDELARKINYYLEQDDKRNIIAAAGYRRCINSAYSESERIKSVMGQVLGIFKSEISK